MTVESRANVAFRLAGFRRTDARPNAYLTYRLFAVGFCVFGRRIKKTAKQISIASIKSTVEPSTAAITRRRHAAIRTKCD